MVHAVKPYNVASLVGAGAGGVGVVGGDGVGAVGVVGGFGPGASVPGTLKTSLIACMIPLLAKTL